MNPKNLVAKLANWRPPSGRNSLEITDDGYNVVVAADGVDGVGCRLWELTARRTLEASAVDLAVRAEQIGQRVTGLLERLRLVEVDATGNTALLRSEQPGQLGDDRLYYEIILHGDGGSLLRRYQTPHLAQPRRRQVAFSLTHEALAKLVGDLTA